MHPRHRHVHSALLAAILAACGGDSPAAPTAPTPIEPLAPSPGAPTAPGEPGGATPPAAAPPTAASPAGAMPEVPAGASVSFATPSDGSVVKGSVTDGKVMVPVRMKVDGMQLEPAGAVKAGSGHHHILIDTAPAARGEVVPADETHLHFGKAQSEALVPLAPGPHELTLQFADGIHRAYGPELTAKISIRVVAAPGAPAPSAAVPAAADTHAEH